MLCHIAGRCHPSHSLRVKCIIEFVLKATLPAEIDMEYYVFHLATLSSAFLAPPPPLRHRPLHLHHPPVPSYEG